MGEETEKNKITKEPKIQKTTKKNETSSIQHTEGDINVLDVADTSIDVLDEIEVMKESIIKDEEKHEIAEEETLDEFVLKIPQQVQNEDDEKIIKQEDLKENKDNDINTRDEAMQIKLLQKENERMENQKKIEAQKLQKEEDRKMKKKQQEQDKVEKQ